MVKIAFISTVDNDDLTFEEAYKEIKDIIEFKILDAKCSEEEFKEFLKFVKDANIVFTKLMGGKEAFKYYDELKEFLLKNNIPFLPLPTTSEFYPELERDVTVSEEIKEEVRKYLSYEGVENYKNLLLYLANKFGDCSIPYDKPKPMPWQGIYYKGKCYENLEEYLKLFKDLNKPKIGILFYRNWFISRNIEYVDYLIEIIEKKGGIPIALFSSHLKNEFGSLGIDENFKRFFYYNNKPIIDVLINTTMFTLSMGVKNDITNEPEFLIDLNVPILQGIVSTDYIENWIKGYSINPIDLVIGMAMPEFDGAIIHFPIAGKEKVKDGDVGVPIIKYKAIKDRAEKIVDLAIKYANLRLKNNKEKRIAIILHNYPPRNDKIASAFGLDSPESVVRLLKELKKRGFHVERLYKNGNELINELLKYPTNDKNFITDEIIKKAVGKIKREDYKKWFNSLSEKVKKELIENWGEIPGNVMNFNGELIIPGIINGNIFISVQPPRGFNEDPSAIYHDPKKPPTHYYIAFYKWIKEVFKADAIMHIGKHGSLEWLPGKGAGLSKDCYPDICMELPNIYPYIVNNPGEGTQAKRRGYATIISHLIPPMTISELYGDLEELERMIDEYYETEKEKKEFLKEEIKKKIKELKLDEDLIDKNINANDFEELLREVHNYLQDLKNRQINDGLHILGKPLDGEKLINMIFMIVRYQFEYLKTIAKILNYDWDELNKNKGKNHKIIDKINKIGIEVIKEFIENEFKIEKISVIKVNDELKKILEIIKNIYDNLMRVKEEIDYAVNALHGYYVPPKVAGAPTKDINCLPTGRNFYSCNPQEIPTKAAYEMGKRLAEELLKKYLEEEGKYPERVGLIVWGSPTMRTKGDDVAEFLYLLGVKPVWNKMGRVVDLEIIPLEELKRPRIDVIARVSGFFRDAFPQLLKLMDKAVNMVANLDEPDDMNFVKKHYKEEIKKFKKFYRIFSDKPGTYGAGISNLLESKNWKSLEDLAKVYVEWGGYAYGENTYGEEAKELFKYNLSKIELTVKNEDSQEWDIFEGDDFNSYHGGMIAAVRYYSKKKPKSYVGDTSCGIKIKNLKEEGKEVFRTKILNPKWINGLKRHGYKGASDFSKYIDHIFQWDATSDIVEDWMYEKIAEKYVFDKKMEEFFKENNPYALLNITERLLEAIERGLWKADDEMKEKLRKKYLEIEGMIEERL
ncbi:cobaltochelatase [Methanocaldococcus villosus KIN24-T80]|uniref:Cobaltochelatase n=1 Tax=Methanocaldococcus villosus KIN24-T80 TaxID=1069083 RepID=N6VQS8_9EURY|nr:cobaltochelatase subunit CobN [Methanocaldococcus villosus]ENN96255.1 cobaltochelatase [Methanocaldococcus villosus KIN24-T80]